MKKILLTILGLAVVIGAGIGITKYEDDSKASKIENSISKMSQVDNFKTKTEYYKDGMKIKTEKILFFNKSNQKKNSLKQQYSLYTNSYYKQVIIANILAPNTLDMSNKESVGYVKSAMSNLVSTKASIDANEVLTNSEKKGYNKMIDDLVKSYKNLLSTNNNVDKNSKDNSNDNKSSDKNNQDKNSQDKNKGDKK